MQLKIYHFPRNVQMIVSTATSQEPGGLPVRFAVVRLTAIREGKPH